MKEKRRQLIWFLVLLSALVLFFATGCKTKTVLVPVDRVKIEYRDRLRIDSVYNRDTVHMFTKNDTVYLQSIKWRERFRLDTVRIEKTDSIPYPVEVVKEVNNLTKWQRWRLNALNVIVAGLLVWLFFVARRLFK